MIFHASALSSYSAKVRIVLCVKQVAFVEQAPARGYRSPEYRAIVPMGTLPAIQLGDWVLSESEVINEFLEEQYPQPPMLPTGPADRARVRFVSRLHDLYLEPAVRALFAQVRPQTRDPEVLARLRAAVLARIDQLAASVQPRPFLCGASLSLADCGPLVSLPLARMVLQACAQPISLPSALQDWLELASAHPDVARALTPWHSATQQWISTQTGGTP